jgi:hypothetical protein
MGAKKKPNIVVVWGDDIGITNLSCYSDGLMGYRTPNIDRIAEEGMRFTDSYGEQSCTAGPPPSTAPASRNARAAARSWSPQIGVRHVKLNAICELLRLRQSLRVC